MNTTIATTFAHNLRQKRKAMGLTQSGLPAKSGVSLVHISKMERGKRNVTSVRAIGIALSKLIRQDDQRQNK